MRNLELKARCADLDSAEQIAQRLGATFGGDLRQVDTYFVVPRGRLKLREIEHAPSELIYYERPEVDATRWSDYHTAPVEHGAAVRDVLERALAVRSQVDKSRRLYLYRGARIHLDRVAGLGSFVEFEVPCNDGEPRGATDLMRDLMRAFDLRDADALSASYSDLVQAAP